MERSLEMYPKIGDLLAFRDIFKILVIGVDEEYSLYRCVILLNLQSNLIPGDIWNLTKKNWELGQVKGTWRLENGTKSRRYDSIKNK
jgi:hypothetical protein